MQGNVKIVIKLIEKTPEDKRKAVSLHIINVFDYYIYMYMYVYMYICVCTCTCTLEFFCTSE